MSQWHRKDLLNGNVPGGYATPLRYAIGLGSGKSGAVHWWSQRLTAAALVPLSIWFVAALVVHAGRGPAGLTAWLARPWVALPAILFLVALFQHLRLGLQVVVEDYVHADRIKFAAVAAIRGACYSLMAAGVFAILVIGLQ